MSVLAEPGPGQRRAEQVADRNAWLAFWGYVAALLMSVVGLVNGVVLIRRDAKGSGWMIVVIARLGDDADRRWHTRRIVSPATDA